MSSTRASCFPGAYHPFYCEENVWHLCRDPAVAGTTRTVAWITNPRRHVAIARQRAGEADGQLVIWDYHVVLLSRTRVGWRVWDPDSTLRWGERAEDYLAASFPETLPRSLAPVFRLVSAREYRRLFASDRSHMRAPDGQWLRPPPPWPPIGEGHRLPDFLDLARAEPGEVVDLDGLRRRLADPDWLGAPRGR